MLFGTTVHELCHVAEKAAGLKFRYRTQPVCLVSTKKAAENRGEEFAEVCTARILAPNLLKQAQGCGIGQQSGAAQFFTPLMNNAMSDGGMKSICEFSPEQLASYDDQGFPEDREGFNNSKRGTFSSMLSNIFRERAPANEPSYGERRRKVFGTQGGSDNTWSAWMKSRKN